jgi:ATP-binding cassette subfamily B protein
MQSDFLMEDTIRENVAFGRAISDGDIAFATENAMAASFIAEKDGGINARLNVKGANVSGGQKQRILISRALAGKPDILILDDSSGGLDYKTDALLRQNLAENYGNTTRVVVAQRVSSIMNSTYIMVLDDGEVIGFGTHAHLMNTCPEYRHIAETQMGTGKAVNG